MATRLDCERRLGGARAWIFAGWSRSSSMGHWPDPRDVPRLLVFDELDIGKAGGHRTFADCACQIQYFLARMSVMMRLRNHRMGSAFVILHVAAVTHGSHSTPRFGIVQTLDAKHKIAKVEAVIT